jgi:hypothetical protein
MKRESIQNRFSVARSSTTHEISRRCVFVGIKTCVDVFFFRQQKYRLGPDAAPRTCFLERFDRLLRDLFLFVDEERFERRTAAH